MPVVATVPALCRFLFRDSVSVVLVLVGCLGASIWALLQYRTEELTAARTAILVTPLFQLLVVYGSYSLFRKLAGREPADVFFDFSGGLVWDRLFAIVTFLVSYLVPLNVIWVLSGNAM